MSSCARKTQQDVNAEWNSMAGEWDDMVSRYRNSFVDIIWEKTKLDPRQKRIVVDFGCGTGLLTEAMRTASSSSEFVCIDAAHSMIRVLEEKIQSFGWERNVRAHCVALAALESADDAIRNDIDALRGKVDLVVASSVIAFVPKADIPATMKTIGELLKPDTGIFCHLDWPPSKADPDGFTVDKANKIFTWGGLQEKSVSISKINVGGSDEDIFVGVAVKKAFCH